MREILLNLDEKAQTGLAIKSPNWSHAEIRDLAQKFEASFVAEMLKHTGLADVSESFGGGAGEEGFRGFLIQAYADDLSETGQIGLADRVYKSLLNRVEE